MVCFLYPYCTCKYTHIWTKEVSIESANSMFVVERYHQPIRKAFSIIRNEAPDTSDTDALQMEVKRMNHSMGPH